METLLLEPRVRPMGGRFMVCKAFLLIAVVVVLTGCATKVRPIDLHDANVPIEGRRLVADAEDGIAIARARLDEARSEQRTVRAWRQQIAGQSNWPNGSAEAVGRLRTLADARVRLADYQVQRAEAELQLAHAKYELITARVAVRHDLAVYDLERLHERADRILNQIREIDRQMALHMETMDKATRSWLKGYESFVRSGGDARSFFIAFDRP
jgi:hypothetical protein